MFSFFKNNTKDNNAEADATPKNEQADRLWSEGSRLLEKRKYDRAIAAMREAYEIEPSRLDGRLNLGAALYLVSEFEEAVKHLNYVLAFEPQNTMALLNLAACHDGLGDLEASIATLERIVSDRPEWKDVHYNLAVAYHKQKRHPEALSQLKEELRINPHHEAARSLLNKIALYTSEKSS